MLPYVVGVVVVLAVVILAAIALGLSRPKDFRVERSTVIAAPPEVVYGAIADYRRWEQWSPWEDRDPNMKRTYAGPDSGVGASYEWDGDKNVGHGRQEIVDATPYAHIEMRLDFFRPFKGTNKVEFTLASKGSGTEVRWIMSGPLHFIVRILGFNMDKMVGEDFAAGLASLKTLLETPA